MRPVSAGSQAAVHAQRPADAGARAKTAIADNLTRLKDNPHAVAGLKKAQARLEANAARFAAATSGTPAAAKTDLGEG